MELLSKPEFSQECRVHSSHAELQLAIVLVIMRDRLVRLIVMMHESGVSVDVLVEKTELAHLMLACLVIVLLDWPRSNCVV